MSAAEISKHIRAQKDLIKLAQEVIDWWENYGKFHSAEYFEKNPRDVETPEFVRLAQKTLQENKP